MQTGYLVRKDWVEKNPQVAAGFVRAITKAWNWSAEHPDQIQTIAAEVIKDHNQDPSLAKFVYAWQRPDGLWKDDDVIFWIQRLQAGGVLKRNLTPSNIFTNQYNPNYNPSTADNT
jgi:ABC-type nitrate/sulfonate/bicarbonate transport system substrate-binding protein